MAKSATTSTPAEVVVNRIVGGVIVTGVVGFGAYLIYNLANKGLNSGGSYSAPAVPSSSQPRSSNTSSTSSGGSKLPAGTFPVKKGDANLKVQEVQKAIIKMGGAAATLIVGSGGADGIFGSGTSAALRVLGLNDSVITQDDYTRILAGMLTANAAANNTQVVPKTNTQTSGGAYIDRVNNEFFQKNPIVNAVKPKVNVYSFPSTNASTVVYTSTNVGEVIGEHKGISTDINGLASNRWAEITTKDGKTGWVFSGDIISAPRNKTASIGSSGLNGLPPQVYTRKAASVYVPALAASEILAPNVLLGSFVSDKNNVVTVVARNGVRMEVASDAVNLF